MPSHKIQNRKRRTAHTFLCYLVWSVALWPLQMPELGCRTAAHSSWPFSASWPWGHSIHAQTAKSAGRWEVKAVHPAHHKPSFEVGLLTALGHWGNIIPQTGFLEYSEGFLGLDGSYFSCEPSTASSAGVSWPRDSVGTFQGTWHMSLVHRDQLQQCAQWGKRATGEHWGLSTTG